jgi:hypothetical protein
MARAAMDEAEVAEAAAFPVPEGAPFGTGHYVIGTFLGVKDADKFERNGSTIRVKPKVGIRLTDDTTLSIAVGEGKAESESSDNALVRALTAGLAPGMLVAMPVQPRPPFGAQGPIKWFSRGSAGGGDDEGWK